MPQGANLFETLMLNLVEYNEERPFRVRGDAPAWEREHDVALENQPTQPAGYLDYLTWQSRTLALQPEDDGDRLVVRRISYAQGRRLDDPDLFDPAMAYRHDDKLGWRALRLSESRALWRDSAALFQVAGRGSVKRPECFNWLQTQVEDGVLKRRQRYDFAAFGLCSDQAKVDFWRHERMPLPLAYLDDVDLVGSLGDALAAAEKLAVVLKAACQRLAEEHLAPNGKADRKRVTAMLESLAPGQLYWSRLEVSFRQFLVDLAGRAGDPTLLRRAVAGWIFDTLVPSVRDAFEQTGGRLDQSARLLRAVAKARQVMNTALARATGEFREVSNEQTA